jgi:hypothetical protein
MVDIFLDIGSQIAKVEVHVFMKERVLVGVEDYFAEFGTDVWDVGEGDAAVVDGEEFVDHGLVGPLGEERGDGIVATVEDQENWRGICFAEVEELFFGVYLILTVSPPILD